MRRTGGLIAMAIVVGLTGCVSAEDASDRARYDAMLEVEGVPGVIVAPYERYVQVDPAASEDEIVATALGVRDILDELGDDRPRDLTLVAVHPGDASVATEFTTRVYEDPDRFERDVRIWAGLLDEGFTQVRYNVFDEAGDGVLNVHAGLPGQRGMTVGVTFDAMVTALGADPSAFGLLQTEAVVDDMLVTNRSGSPALPPGWSDALDQIAELDFISSSNARFELDATLLALRSTLDPTPEQLVQLMSILDDGGVLHSSVSVTFTAGDADPRVLYGVTV